MFLSKKNAQYLNKPTKGKQILPRVLPGWGDDEQSDSKKEFKYEYKNNNKPTQDYDFINLLGQKQEYKNVKIQNMNERSHKQSHGKKIYYNWDQLNQMNNIQCQKRLVENIVEPGGVKVKPTENLLTQFAKQVKSMDPAIVGSLLLSKVEENYPYLVKAKSLYTIEYLVKKNPVFLNYFQTQTQVLQNSPQPEDNVQSFRKILKSVLNIIGVITEKNEGSNDNQAISFVDPGYNDTKQEPNIKGFLANNQKFKKPVGPSSKKFISPNDAKKTTVEPQKKNDIFDIFSDNKQSTQKSQPGFDDLLLLGNMQQTQPPQNKNLNNITFDDLLK